MELELENSSKLDALDTTTKFIKELRGYLDRENIKYDEQNFINELGREFSIEQKYLDILSSKIDSFLKSLDKNVGSVLSIGYDKNKNYFYQTRYKENKIEKVYNEFAKDYGVGNIFIHYKNSLPDDNVWYHSANFIKDDIKSVINENFRSGKDVKEIDFNSLKEKYEKKYKIM